MTITPPIFAGILVAISATWILCLLSIRSDLVSMARHRLWRIRDEVMDDVIQGRLPKARAVLRVIDDIEVTITNAHRFGLFEWIFMPAPPAEWIKEYVSRREEEDRELPEHLHARLEAFRLRYRRQLTLNIFLTSICGCIVFAIGCAIAISVGAAKGIHKKASSPLTYLERSMNGIETSEHAERMVMSFSRHDDSCLSACV